MLIFLLRPFAPTFRVVLLEPRPWIEIEFLVDEISNVEEIADYGGYLAFSHSVDHHRIA